MIALKRVYEPPAVADGTRILVERLWPRGLDKAHAQVDEWLKEVAPSTALRRWFAHDPDKWAEFQRRYREELAHKPELLEQLRHKAGSGKITLVFAARDEQHNSALVLKQLLEKP